jgi:hypothetical protein
MHGTAPDAVLQDAVARGAVPAMHLWTTPSAAAGWHRVAPDSRTATPAAR